MKKSMALLAILCTIFFYSESLHASLSKNPSDVIPKGETLVYEVRWNPPFWMFFLPTISAGEMMLKFHNSIDYKGEKAFRITAEAVSSGFLPKLTGFTVKNYYESLVNTERFCSTRFTEIAREEKTTRPGRRKRYRNKILTIDYKKRVGNYLTYDATQNPPKELKNKNFEEFPVCVQDFLSAVYQTRLKEIKVGDTYLINISNNGIIKKVKIRAMKKETVIALAGTYSTIKIKSSSVRGLFKGGGSLVVWITDDNRKMPVKYEAKAWLGKVFGTIMKIEDASGKKLTLEPLIF
ncbi:MAG: DUF3108 domain-containing protein [Acidobacteriia bacterium]|nr:DUF3108 domain-containing protein [Terriglobia bacterium]